MKVGRSLILALIVFLLTPVVAGAQGAKSLPRIGWVRNMAAPPLPVTAVEGLQKGLRELGYVEGQNLLIEYRWAAGKLDRLPDLVAEVVSRKVDVLVVAEQQGLDAAKARAGATPVVLVACDPLEALLGSPARPGGNITGLPCVSSELASKRLAMLKELIPRLSRVAVLHNPGDPNKAIEIRQLDAAARVFAITIQAVAVEEPERFEAAFLTMTRAHAQAFVTLADPFMNFHRRRIVELAARHRLPVIYGFREYVKIGGLISYGASVSETFHRAATYVHKILKGAKPADLPVEQPTKFELVIKPQNCEGARADDPTVAAAASGSGHPMMDRRFFPMSFVGALVARTSMRQTTTGLRGTEHCTSAAASKTRASGAPTALSPQFRSQDQKEGRQ